MLFNYIYHIYNIFFCYFKYNKFKKNFIGTNSKNCFIKKKTPIFFSIIKEKKILINNIKIFQNKINFLTKIFFFIIKKLFYKKIYGKIINFFCINILSKIVKLISIIIKTPKIIKKKYFNIYYIKKKNFLFKIIFFFKKINNLTSFLFNHNDLFKDNIIVKGFNISSLIDLNNFNYLKINNDLNILLLEFSENYFFKNNILLENYYKFKKNKINLNKFIIKIFFLRKKKKLFLKNIKNSVNYLKKYFYEKNF
ncbi:hypothetical protein ACJEC8_00175 [Candidatus Carsonella ruddii]|uniref:hypothetical protein n=1 Tax=Carsonella ruddii TaxID=114186 RepID=UPI003D54623A